MHLPAAMPGRKPTDAEMFRRIEFTIGLVNRSLRTGEIKDALRKEFGDMDHATCLRLLARARGVLLTEAGETKDSLRAKNLARYEALLRDQDASVADKVRVLNSIDRLFGLEAPTRTELSGPGGGPLVVNDERDLPDTELAGLLTAAARDMLPANFNGNGHSNGNGSASNGHAE